MGEKLASIATAFVGAMTAIVIVTHPRTRGTVSSIGGAFIGSLRELRLAGR